MAEPNSPTTASSPVSNVTKIEILVVIAAIAAWFVFNLLTASRYPLVWIDEVNYSDPAINLRLGHGFTSSTWYTQPSHEFWAGNVPLHEVLLYLWIGLFGDSITAVRSINYVYTVLACLLLWRGVIRLELIKKSAYRLLLIALVLGGYGAILCYRSGRPDCLPMCLVAALFYLYSLKERWWRWTLIFLIGFAAPWAGLQLAPMFFVGGVLLFIYLRRSVTREIATLWSGAAVGTIALICWYESWGMLDRFLASTRPHADAEVISFLVHQTPLGHFQLQKDFSLVPLVIAALLLAWVERKKYQTPWRSPLFFAILYSASLALALTLFAKFPTYYSWMTYVPLAICVCATLSGESLRQFERRVGLFLTICCIAAGLFYHGKRIVSRWADSDYGLMERFIQENVQPEDVMYGEYSTYYAGKKRAREFFGGLYINPMLESEKQRLTVLVIAPTATNILERIGGSWAPTGASRLAADEHYSLRVLRRSDQAKR